MKRLLCLLLALLLLAGCSAAPAQTTAPTESLPPETTAPAETVGTDLKALGENLPVMDGSTSLIPLEAAIRSAIFGIDLEEATAQVAHSTTWNAFSNLLWGDVELVFSCPLSQTQWDMAEEQGVELETVPVAMEGFVFLVNADNPVDTLTQAQLRDIYSGKITNWSEVGGEDEPIIPYQRNNDSGSQNFMIDFMGDAPLMDAPMELRPATMEGLMDIVAVNDNASGAIGYSVYAYAANMYGNGNEIKFIKVDGVAPDKQTMASGEYPLLGKNYAIFRASEPEDSPVRDLVNWMTSYDGQTAIAKAGYVTVMDIGFDYEEMTLTLWEGTGTGPAASEPASFEYTLTQVLHDEWGDQYSEFLPVTVEDGVSKIQGVTAPKLEAEINAFLAEQTAWTKDAHDQMSRWVNTQNRGEEYGAYSLSLPWDYYGFISEALDHICLATAKNGYLSVAVTICCSDNRTESGGLHYRTETATWDLVEGRRLQPEELFCEGVDVDSVLNNYIRTFSQEPLDTWGIYPEMKQDFAGLPLTGWHLTHDAIYIDQDNPYFLSGQRIPLDELPDGILVSETPRSFGTSIDHEKILVHKNWRISDRDSRYAYNSDGLVSCGFLKEEVHPNAAKINAEVMDHLDTYFTRDAILGYYAQFGVDETSLEIWMLDWDLYNLGSKYLLFQGNSPYHMTDNEEDSIEYPHIPFLLYDLESGEQIDWTVLLTNNWRDGITTATRYPGAEEAELPADGLTITHIYPQTNGSLYMTFLHGKYEYTVSLPWDYVNY